jgi:hypothetical protein
MIQRRATMQTLREDILSIRLFRPGRDTGL